MAEKFAREVYDVYVGSMTVVTCVVGVTDSFQVKVS